ncbi:hypothetical protein VTK56DRAFT_4664 [Thermocarpiscus australiensis]
MPTFLSPHDSTPIFYRYHTPSSGAVQPLTLVFLHGWPMSSRMFDALILPLVEEHRFRVIAPDRRGFGHSDWSTPRTASPVTFDTFVADVVALLRHLSPGPFVFVAASMGASESLLAYYAADAAAVVRAHCRGFVWIGPNMPYSVRCPEFPRGVDPAVWDALMQGFRAARAKDFIREQVPGIFRTDLGNEVGEATLRFYEGLVQQADPVALERTMEICRRPVEKELRALAADGESGRRMPVMILHGDSDAGMPLEVSSAVVKEMVPWVDLKVYERAGHGE